MSLRRYLDPGGEGSVSQDGRDRRPSTQPKRPQVGKCVKLF